ncbi:MAG TPA: alpha-1,4-glucan--maltose-1-phosphate maltosyltransferase [Capillimicrobium sp.]|nr:alpha-1,4-glucan--maltose-1-phosphate maltosyltransferase [Capillimicrobium sp.]
MPSSRKPPPPRIQIEDPAPSVDCGRYPSKACVGDVVDVYATIFKDGHDVLRAVVRYRGPADASDATAESAWHEAPMRRIDAHLDGDRWQGSFPVTTQGRYTWTIEAWTDHWATWCSEVQRKVEAGQEDLSGELSEGAVLLRETAARAGGEDGARLVQAAEHLTVDLALDPEIAAIVERHPDRSRASCLDGELHVEVDRVRARFGSWYELFPRSFGGLRGVADHVPRLAELGFDVIYLPPIHPIGTTNRKGRNNALVAEPDDPGSPWAIGAPEGGHDAIHPDLGTLEDFDHLVATCERHGMEIALDFAIQTSPDHPWLREHPEWFHRRPDGTLKYAENPPKRYQDIYNVNWECEDWEGLWHALRDVVLHWVRHGVRIFRVDNPHTKPLPFWEWLIREVRRDHPDVLFLAEAFTRGAMMRTLAKVGFNQSYTYFTWKSSRWELTEYLTELTTSGMQDYYRPNFFANTPDILTEELQHGGPPAFALRLVLAATLSPTYGIYSGFESFENVPVRPGSEEYLDSEKYEVKARSLDGPLLPLVARMNEIRREHPALQHLTGLRFLETENDALVAYAKRHGDDLVICVVNINPHHAEEGVAIVPYELGLPPAFAVVDLIKGERFDWHMGRNYVRLDPADRPAHVLAVVRR